MSVWKSEEVVTARFAKNQICGLNTAKMPQTKDQTIDLLSSKLLFLMSKMARPERFERPTLRFVVFSCHIFALFLNVPIRDFSYIFHYVAVSLHS